MDEELFLEELISDIKNGMSKGAIKHCVENRLKDLKNNIALGGGREELSNLIKVTKVYIEDGDDVEGYNVTGRTSQVWITKEDFDEIKCINN